MEEIADELELIALKVWRVPDKINESFVWISENQLSFYKYKVAKGLFKLFNQCFHM